MKRIRAALPPALRGRLLRRGRPLKDEYVTPARGQCEGASVPSVIEPDFDQLVGAAILELAGPFGCS